MENCNKIVRKIHIKTSWIGWRNLTFIARSQSRVYPYAHSQFIKLGEVTTLCTGYVMYGRRHTGTVNTHYRYLMVKSPSQGFAYRKGNFKFLGPTLYSDTGSSPHPREEVRIRVVILWSLFT